MMPCASLREAGGQERGLRHLLQPWLLSACTHCKWLCVSPGPRWLKVGGWVAPVVLPEYCCTSHWAFRVTVVHPGEDGMGGGCSEVKHDHFCLCCVQCRIIYVSLLCSYRQSEPGGGSTVEECSYSDSRRQKFSSSSVDTLMFPVVVSQPVGCDVLQALPHPLWLVTGEAVRACRPGYSSRVSALRKQRQDASTSLTVPNTFQRYQAVCEALRCCWMFTTECTSSHFNVHMLHTGYLSLPGGRPRFLHCLICHACITSWDSTYILIIALKALRSPLSSCMRRVLIWNVHCLKRCQPQI